MKLTRRVEINENAVWTMIFKKDNVEVGYMFQTYHPKIPYEVYESKTLKNRRVMNEDEAEKWLIQKLENE